MTNEDDAILKEAADTTAKQLADGWLTWPDTQQTPASTQPVKNSEQVEENCDLDSCASKQWQLSVQKKEMLDAVLDSSILSPFCDALPEFDCQAPEFPPVEELNCDPYSTEYTNAIFQALHLDGLEYSTFDADIMKGFKELICQYPTAFLVPGRPLGAVSGFEHRIDRGDTRPISYQHYLRSIYTSGLSVTRFIR